MEEERLESIYHYLEENQDDIIKNLCELVKIESVSSNLKKVNDALEFVLDLGRSFGFRAMSYLNGQVGVIEMGDGDEVLGILSHVDVVDGGNLDKWLTKPFEPVIKEDKIFGRGTLDDKGALIASLYAMKAVYDLGQPLKKRVQLIIGTQEEVQWVDMESYVKEYSLPDYGFTPDGEYPICNIEKGCLGITINFPLDKSEVGIKDGKFLTYIDAGFATNIIPGTCVAEITEYKNDTKNIISLKSKGKSVHSSQPEKGENAIFNMIDQIKIMNLENNKMLNILNLINSKLRDMYGKQAGLYNDSEYFNGEFVHRNVFSPTVLKTENDFLRLHIDIRFSYGSDESHIIGFFKEFAKSCDGEIINIDLLPAVYVSKDKKFLQVFKDSYEKVTGLTNEFSLAYGGSYAKAMPNIVSWGPIFPGEEDTCHEENEYININSLMNNAKIFSLAISEIVLTNESFK